MHRRGLRPLIACFTLAIACTDPNPASTATAASTSTSTATGTGTSTSTDTSTSTVPTTSSASAAASSSSGDPPTTGPVDTTSVIDTTSAVDTTSAIDTTSTASTADLSTSSSTTAPVDSSTGTTDGQGSSSSGGNLEPPPAPAMPAGCNFCDCCDPWPVSWSAVPGATHYVVRWKCSINPEQVHDVGNKTAIADVCNDIDMCNGMCAFTVGYIKVQACNEDGCSALVNIPAEQSPITCGGGCCC